MPSNSSKKKKTLYYWLNVIFGLFAILPIAGFVYFGIKYGFLHDKFIKPFLIGVLVYSLVGFTVLRKIFDKITNISREFSRKIATDLPGAVLHDDGDEIGNIVVSFQTIETHRSQFTLPAIVSAPGHVQLLQCLRDAKPGRLNAADYVHLFIFAHTNISPPYIPRLFLYLITSRVSSATAVFRSEFSPLRCLT